MRYIIELSLKQIVKRVNTVVTRFEVIDLVWILLYRRVVVAVGGLL